ncbi:MAG: hypothetical protein AAGF11_54745 [Myxococcota bacterium]
MAGLTATTTACGAAQTDDDSGGAAVEEALAQPRTTACDPTQSGLYVQARINTGTSQHADFAVTFYTDEDCTEPLVQIRTEVERELGEALEMPAGAYELDVARLALFATAASEDGARALVDAGCPGQYPPTQEVDVSATGCFGFEAVDDCGFDFDIVALQHDVLFGGSRGGNMCVPEGRPIILGDTGFARP